MTTTTSLKVYKKEVRQFDIEKLEDNFINGKLGLILYYLNLYRNKKQKVYVHKIKALLIQIFANVENPKKQDLFKQSNLAFGLSGFAYVLTLLIEENLIEEDFKMEVDQISEVVFEQALEMIDQNNFGYINGPIGNLWCLFRTQKESYCKQIIATLYQKSLTDKYLFYTVSEDPFVAGMNLGIAHGHLGIVKVLLDISEYGWKTKEGDYLIDRIINSCLSYLDFDSKTEDVSIFKPYRMYLENETLVSYQNGRLSWINSDLSLAYFLYKASAYRKQSDWLYWAEKIALETTKRISFETTKVEYPHICYGSSGIALVYQALFEFTKNTIFYESQQFWLQKTQDLLEAEIEWEWNTNDMSLLNGKLGALLVLSNATTFESYTEVFL